MQGHSAPFYSFELSGSGPDFSCWVISGIKSMAFALNSTAKGYMNMNMTWLDLTCMSLWVNDRIDSWLDPSSVDLYLWVWRSSSCIPSSHYYIIIIPSSAFHANSYLVLVFERSMTFDTWLWFADKQKGLQARAVWLSILPTFLLYFSLNFLTSCLLLYLFHALYPWQWPQNGSDSSLKDKLNREWMNSCLVRGLLLKLFLET